MGFSSRVFSKDFSYSKSATGNVIYYKYENLRVKGALDKYDIYLFISNSLDDFKLNQYWNFQLILPMHFHFMMYCVNSIISRVAHRLLYCVFIEVDFEK